MTAFVVAWKSDRLLISSIFYDDDLFGMNNSLPYGPQMKTLIIIRLVLLVMCVSVRQKEKWKGFVVNNRITFSHYRVGQVMHLSRKSIG